MARLYPAADPRQPMDFAAIDALAAHLLRQRPGRAVVAWPMRGALADSAGDVREADLLSVWSAPANKAPALRAALESASLAEAFADDACALTPAVAQSLGHAEGATLDQLDAALTRIRTAGGLAA